MLSNTDYEKSRDNFLNLIRRENWNDEDILVPMKGENKYLKQLKTKKEISVKRWNDAKSKVSNTSKYINTKFDI